MSDRATGVRLRVAAADEDDVSFYEFLSSVVGGHQASTSTVSPTDSHTALSVVENTAISSAPQVL